MISIAASVVILKRGSGMSEGHSVTRVWGLGDKTFEVAYHSGDAYQIELQMVELRAQLENLKKVCPHKPEWLRHKYHQFKQSWGVSYWETAECANCLHTIRSRDETLMYEEDNYR
jgi:hypothetical protein